MSTSPGRFLALDVGNRRIGVAVSDPLALLARGLTTIQRKNTAQAVAEVTELVKTWEPVAVIVGLPRNMNDTLGTQARRAMGFARELEASLSIPIILWDERLSTFTASEILHERGLNAAAQKGRIDAVAAAVILQDYLDARQADQAGLPPINLNEEP